MHVSLLSIGISPSSKGKAPARIPSSNSLDDPGAPGCELSIHPSSPDLPLSLTILFPRSLSHIPASLIPTALHPTSLPNFSSCNFYASLSAVIPGGLLHQQTSPVSLLWFPASLARATTPQILKDENTIHFEFEVDQYDDRTGPGVREPSCPQRLSYIPNPGAGPHGWTKWCVRARDPSTGRAGRRCGRRAL